MARVGQTEAYNLPWSLGRTYVESSRDSADDRLFEEKEAVVSYGRSIWKKYSRFTISKRRKLIETYLEAMKGYIPEDKISEIKSAKGL